MCFFLTIKFFALVVVLPFTCCIFDENKFAKKLTEFNNDIERAFANDTPLHEKNELIGILKNKYRNALENALEQDEAVGNAKGLEYKLIAQNDIAEKEKKEIRDRYSNALAYHCCGKEIRYGLEGFGIGVDKDCNKVLKVNRSDPKLKERITIVQTLFSDRVSSIRFHAYRLQDLYRQSQTVADLTAGWNANVAEVYKMLRRLPGGLRSSEVMGSETDLFSLLTSFQNAPNENEAVQIFKSQCKACHWSRIFLHLKSGKDQIKNLASAIPENWGDDVSRHMAKERMENPNNYKMEDIGYIGGLYRVGAFFLYDQPRYSCCFEVFYYSSHTQYIESVLDKLRAMFPTKYDPNLIHEFCFGLNKLYELVSNTDIRASSKYYDLVCSPNSTHINQYLQEIGKDSTTCHQQIFYVIAESLGIYKSNPKK